MLPLLNEHHYPSRVLIELGHGFLQPLDIADLEIHARLAEHDQDTIAAEQFA